MVPVVQLVRASDCGSECRGFESHRAPGKMETFWPPFFSCARWDSTPFFYFANAKALHFIPLGGPPGPLSLAYSLRPNTLYLRKIVTQGNDTTVSYYCVITDVRRSACSSWR